MISTSHRLPDLSESDRHESFTFQAAPGTEILFDDDGFLADRLQHLEHITKGDSRVLLVPQPSKTDPNDPLRWSDAKKAIVFFFAFMGSITGPIMAAAEID
ncbi:hypothetical protein VTO42DRAFT_7922 [Malbranchea cinnamomea]